MIIEPFQSFHAWRLPAHKNQDGSLQGVYSNIALEIGQRTRVPARIRIVTLQTPEI
jgi:hypothetical protein